MSLRGKAVVTIVAVLVVFFGAAITIEYRSMKQRVVAMRDAEITADFLRYRHDIEDFTDHQGAAAATLADLGSWLYGECQRLPDLDARKAAMELVLSQIRTAMSPAILGGGLWYEPFSLDPDQRWIGAYAVVEEPGKARPTWEYSTDDYAYTRHGWYTIAVPEDWDRSRPRRQNRYMTEPYLDSLSGRPTVFITLTHVMYSPDHQRIIGVSTADWTLDSLNKTLARYRITDNSFAFLVHAESGKVLFPVARDQLEQISDTPWGHHLDLDRAEIGQVTRRSGLKVRGRTYDVIFTKTEEGFVFGHFVDTAEAYEFVGSVARRALLPAALLLLLAALAMYLLVSRLIAPIRKLADATRKIADDADEHDIPITSRDEIGELAIAFNQAHRHLRDNAAALEATAAELRASEEHFRALIEYGADIIAVIANDGTIDYASPSVKRTLGHEPDQLQGKPLADLIHPDDTEPARIMLDRLSDSSSALETAELRLRGADGAWRTVEAAGIVSPRGIVINARDVTERRHAEAALRKSELQLRQAAKLEAVGQLAGGVAHDFNNAMTAVLGMTDLLLRRHKDQPRLTAALRDIKAAGEHAASLTRRLLTFSRSHVTERTAVDLNAVVRDVEKMLRRLIGEEVELTTDLADRQLSIRGDARELEQVLVNLAVNAKDAMPEGGQLSVATSFEQVTAPQLSVTGQIEPGPYCVLRVGDTGVGMEPHTLANIFDPFFSTKGIESGTGLGLSIVYGIVEDSEGYILVDSNPGGGTRFAIYWPPSELPHQADSSQERPLAQGHGESILVVEDDPRVRKTTVTTLSSNGYRVVEAGAGPEALRMVDAGTRVDLLVSDVVMPQMRGPELALQMRRRLPGLLVVLVSGYSAGAVDAAEVDRGTYAYLQKPFTVERLLTEVRRLLDQRAAGHPEARLDRDPA